MGKILLIGKPLRVEPLDILVNFSSTSSDQNERVSPGGAMNIFARRGKRCGSKRAGKTT
jgi:hypothetical protein